MITFDEARDDALTRYAVALYALRLYDEGLSVDDALAAAREHLYGR